MEARIDGGWGRLMKQSRAPIRGLRRSVVPLVAICVLAGAAQAFGAGSAYASSEPALYAYAAGTAASPLRCPKSIVVAHECTLTEALALAPSGARVLLAGGGAYVGVFSLSSSVTLAPAPGVVQPTISCNLESSGSPCYGAPALSVPPGIVAIVDAITFGPEYDAGCISDGGTVFLNDVSVDQCVNEESGGGVDIWSGATLDVSGSTFSGDFSGDVMSEGTDGGAIFNGGGTLSVKHSSFSGDSNTFSSGGAIANEDGGTATISKVSLSGNGSYEGGSIFSSGTLSMVDTTISDDSSSLNGAAVFNSGTLKVSGSTFSGNVAVDGGGAIDNTGALAVSASTFSSNSTGGNGGAIDNGGALTVTTSTFSNNSTYSYDRTNDGGAVFNGGSLTVTTSTFANNSAGTAEESYDGGAIENGDDGSTTVVRSTFDGNAGENTIDNAGGAVTIAGSIMADSSTPECSGGITDAGFNLEEDRGATCGFDTADHDLVGVDPALGALQDNGGQTQTLEPSSTSPVLDQIPNPASVTVSWNTFTLCPAHDQRGARSPAATYGCAMGSVDLENTGLPILTTTTPTSGGPAGGRVVTLRGVNLAGATAVTFGGVSASLVVISAKKILVDAPAGTAGATVPVAVTTSAGSSPWRPGDEFTYT
jgi:hypothetical protein